MTFIVLLTSSSRRTDSDPSIALSQFSMAFNKVDEMDSSVDERDRGGVKVTSGTGSGTGTGTGSGSTEDGTTDPAVFEAGFPESLTVGGDLIFGGIYIHGKKRYKKVQQIFVNNNSQNSP